ncbi:hypothetical protein AJ79_05304 [Helicocarpus griseus UAMH5409]|uniref:Uncharacterized protein n=1 Tax=Helicocarpus griseus UAMH5409 TaxID=1447875 RepID=A0A2B7XPM2_9EURO|nr:hypothetical protein AJ79_05304 [Helicocarpus griseus UAMH5409]
MPLIADLKAKISSRRGVPDHEMKAKPSDTASEATMVASGKTTGGHLVKDTNSATSAPYNGDQCFGSCCRGTGYYR